MHARTRLADVQATRPYREADGEKNGAGARPVVTGGAWESRGVSRQYGFGGTAKVVKQRSK